MNGLSPSSPFKPTASSPGVVNSRSWLTALLALVILGDLVLVHRHESAGQVGITMVCWMAVAVSLGRRPSGVARFNRSSVGFALGAVLILALSVALFRTDESWTQMLALYPAWAGLALGLLAGGFPGAARYWRELLILLFLGIPHGFLLGLVDLASATARFSAFLLHYGGQNVVLTGTEISLPGGAVEVVKSCDGTGAMAYLACLAVVFLVLFPVSLWQRIFMVPLAMAIAFVTNGIRVALLAVIESSAGAHAFDYWHTGTGAMLWTGLPVLLFGLICFCVLHFQPAPVDAGAAAVGMRGSRSN